MEAFCCGRSCGCRSSCRPPHAAGYNRSGPANSAVRLPGAQKQKISTASKETTTTYTTRKKQQHTAHKRTTNNKTTEQTQSPAFSRRTTSKAQPPAGCAGKHSPQRQTQAIEVDDSMPFRLPPTRPPSPLVVRAGHRVERPDPCREPVEEKEVRAELLRDQLAEGQLLRARQVVEVFRLPTARCDREGREQAKSNNNKTRRRVPNWSGYNQRGRRGGQNRKGVASLGREEAARRSRACDTQKTDQDREQGGDQDLPLLQIRKEG